MSFISLRKPFLYWTGAVQIQDNKVCIEINKNVEKIFEIDAVSQSLAIFVQTKVNKNASNCYLIAGWFSFHLKLPTQKMVSPSKERHCYLSEICLIFHALRNSNGNFVCLITPLYRISRHIRKLDGNGVVRLCVRLLERNRNYIGARTFRFITFVTSWKNETNIVRVSRSFTAFVMHSACWTNANHRNDEISTASVRN